MKAPHLLGTLVLTLLLSPAAAAQHELVLKDHHLLMGKVLSSTPDSVTFQHDIGGKQETVVFKADELDPHSFYIIRKDAIGTDGSDAQAHVQLAKYCQANGLFTRARNQWILAARIDPSLQTQSDAARTSAEAGEAAQLLATAKAQQALGQTDEAWDTTLSIIRFFPSSPSANEARALSGQLFDKIVSDKKVREAALEKKVAGHAMSEESGRIQSMMQRAAAQNSQALKDNDLSRSLREYEGAAQTYEEVLRDLKQLSEKYGKDPSVSKEIAGMMSSAQEEAVDVYINAGSVYLTRTDYQGALKEANLALAVDPESASAKSFRSRVGQASSDSSAVAVGGRIRR